MADFQFDPQRRLNYFTGQFLQQEDFQQQQQYHVDRLQRHDQFLHTPGVLDGLHVTGSENDTKVNVSAGTALTRDGVLIVVRDSDTGPTTVPLPAALANQTVLVVLSSEEVKDKPATVGDKQPTRIFEHPLLDVKKESEVPADSPLIRLARLTLNAAGKLTAASIDESVQVKAGANVGDDLNVKRLHLKSGAVATDWPVLSSSGSGKSSLTGDLSVSGQLSAAGFTGNLLSNFRVVKSETVDVPGGDLPIVIADNVTADKVTPHFALITALVRAPGATQDPNIDPRIRYGIGTTAGTMAIVLQLHNDGGKGRVTYKVIALNG